MPKCPDCSGFTSKDTEVEPEVQTGPDVDENGQVTMSVRIVNNCAECSNELEEATFELEATLPENVVQEHTGPDHELECGEETVERTDSGGGRYAKRMFGVEVTVPVSCTCGGLEEAEVEMKDQVASSGMDSLV